MDYQQLTSLTTVLVDESGDVYRAGEFEAYT